MNVTFLAEKLDSTGGGSSWSLDLLAKNLVSEGHQIKILTLRSKNNNIPKSRDYEVISYHINDYSPADRAIWIREILNRHENKSDIYHIFSPNLITGGGLYAHDDDAIPVISRLNSYSYFCTNTDKMKNSCYDNCTSLKKTIHDDSRKYKKIMKIPFHFSRKHLEPKLANNIGKFIAISPSVKQIYINNGIDEDDIEVIPNSYDPDFTCANENNKRTDSIKILYVGRLRKKKGVDILIHSLKNMKHMPNIQVDIVGDGSAKESLITLAEDLGVSSKVNFRGWIDHDDLPPYYASADIFVHPGRWPEPFGRTLLEALQHGCIPIVSNIGGPPWVVGNAGKIFEPGNPADLASKIEKTINTQNMTQEKHDYNYKKEIERFSPDKITNKLISEYELQIGSK